MKTIGLIGGMSWESSLEYYRIINRIVKEKLGEPHSCKCILYSVDFAEYDRLQHQGEWDIVAREMTTMAQKLEIAGADLILICTNTMHKVAQEIIENIKTPLLHIADAAADEIQAKSISKVGLMGTRFTMEENFYQKRLKDRNGIEVIIPDEAEREIIHRVIYSELISGILNEDSRNQFKAIIKNLKDKGAEGVVLGCTEIPLLIKDEDSDIPLFNTTMLHARKAVGIALE